MPFTPTGKIRFAAVVLMGALASGCMYHEVSHHTQPASLGQELADLQVALDAGAITRVEYERLKSKVINRYGQSPVEEM